MDGMGAKGLASGLAVCALALGGCASVLPDDGSGAPGGDTASTAPADPDGSDGSGSPTAGGGVGGLDGLGDPGVGGVQGGDVGGAGRGSAAPIFPLTVHRTGGIAGFDDRLTLRADGRVIVNTLSVHDRLCTLSGATRSQMMTALEILKVDPLAPGGLGVSGQGSDDGVPAGGGDLDGSNGPSDPIVVTVTDHHGRVVDLSDASLGSVSTMVNGLLTDVTLTTPAVTSCTTPTTVPAS